MHPIQKIVLATHNPHKVEELKELLEPYGVEVLSSADFNLCAVKETGQTFAENAVLKAESVCKELGLPCLADDSGLCVDALEGRPGVHTARYGEGNLSAKLLKDLKGVSYAKRTAQAVCVLAFALPGHKTEIFESRVPGFILTQEKGKSAFGFDPIFLPEGEQRSYAEMPREKKNVLSHRGRALSKFLSYLKK